MLQLVIIVTHFSHLIWFSLFLSPSTSLVLSTLFLFPPDTFISARTSLHSHVLFNLNSRQLPNELRPIPLPPPPPRPRLFKRFALNVSHRRLLIRAQKLRVSAARLPISLCFRFFSSLSPHSPLSSVVTFRVRWRVSPSTARRRDDAVNGWSERLRRVYGSIRGPKR